MNPFLLLALGFLLIFLEFFLPGAILGTIGGLMVIASIAFFAAESGSSIGVALYILAIFVGLGLLIKFSLWRIKSSKSRFTFYSDAAQSGYQASHFDKKAIGREGIVLTDLKPGGYILIDGKQHQALSKTGYIVKGSTVLVIGGQEETLIVQAKQKEA